MKQKLSDYVMDFLASHGVRHIFGLPGGGAMHLNDSAGKHASIEVVGTLHEQAATVAAESYAKVTGGLGVVMVTSGPGATNAVTGVASSWVDSTPILVLSGQVKRGDLKGDTGVRQRGMQEIDIVSAVKSMTKYAALVDDPTRIRWHLERAVHEALSGRPGPVWLDLPLDVQGAPIEPAELEGYVAAEVVTMRDDELDALAAQVIDELDRAERPVLLAGSGVGLARGRDALRAVVEELQLPMLLTWPALDLLPSAHPLCLGRPGAMAPRFANFALQNSDLLIAVGARLDLSITGYATEHFARAARKIMVDVDPAELRKHHGRIDLPIEADARWFLEALGRAARARPRRSVAGWLERCQAWKAAYPIDIPASTTDAVSTYGFTRALSKHLREGDVLATGASGAASEMFFLTIEVGEGQRCYTSAAYGAMGYGPPLAIGGCIGSGRRRTICVDGDGGLQLNVQELATIRRLDLPIKLFIINNGGYASIRNSQRRYFDRLVLADATSGMELPPLAGLVAAYGLPYARIASPDDLEHVLPRVLEAPGPCVIEVIASTSELRAPALGTVQTADGGLVSRPLEDLWPFLPREELARNMLIPMVPEPKVAG